MMREREFDGGPPKEKGVPDLDEQPTAGNDNLPPPVRGRLPIQFWLIFAGLVAAIALASAWWALRGAAP